MKALFTSFVLTLVLATTAVGQSSDPYLIKLKEMFDVSGVEATYQMAIIQMIDMYKQQSPEVNPAIWDEMQAEFLGTSIDDLVEMLVPVYKKHLTLKDLEDMIAFYKTPIGQKFVESTPHIMEGSMEVGQLWGMKVGQDLVKKLEQRGY